MSDYYVQGISRATSTDLWENFIWKLELSYNIMVAAESNSFRQNLFRKDVSWLNIDFSFDWTQTGYETFVKTSRKVSTNEIFLLPV